MNFVPQPQIHPPTYVQPNYMMVPSHSHIPMSTPTFFEYVPPLAHTSPRFAKRDVSHITGDNYYLSLHQTPTKKAYIAPRSVAFDCPPPGPILQHTPKFSSPPENVANVPFQSPGNAPNAPSWAPQIAPQYGQPQHPGISPPMPSHPVARNPHLLQPDLHPKYGTLKEQIRCLNAANAVFRDYGLPEYAVPAKLPEATIPWVPANHTIYDPSSLSQAYLPPYVPRTEPPPQTLPPLPHCSRLSLATLFQDTPTELKSTLVFENPDKAARYDRSPAEISQLVLEYPLGFRDDDAIIGFEKQKLIRSPMRHDDIAEVNDGSTCPICNKMVAVENVSNVRLRNHILTCHFKQLTAYAISVTSQQEFARDLLAWSLSAGFAPQIFDDPTFQAIVRKYTMLDPVGSDTIRRKLDALAEQCKGELTNVLQGAESTQTFLTIDEWTSASSQTYVGILVALIDRIPNEKGHDVDGESFQRIIRRRLIAYHPVSERGAHDLATILATALHTVGLTTHDAIGIISDNCAVMKSLSNITLRARLPCMAHVLQSAIETLWTPKFSPREGTSTWPLRHNQFFTIQIVVRNCIRRIRWLFEWIRASANRQEQLRKLQQAANKKPLAVHLDVITRWDSVRLMLNRFMEIYDQLLIMWRCYTEAEKLPSSEMFTIAEFKLLSALQVVLQHSCHVQESLCSDGPTLSRALPSMFRLVNGLHSHTKSLEKLDLPEFSPPQISNTPRSSHSLLEAYRNVVTDNFVPAGHILHSTFKDEGRCDKLLGLLAHILSTAIQFYWPYFDVDKQLPVTTTQRGSFARPESHIATLYAVAAMSSPSNLSLSWIQPCSFFKVGQQKKHAEARVGKVKKAVRAAYKREYDRLSTGRDPDPYLGFVLGTDAPPDITSEPLDQWWFKSGAKKYPVAFQAAQMSLLADATACEIERVNSRASHINAKQRRAMSPVVLGDQVRMSYNMRRLQREEEELKRRFKPSQDDDKDSDFDYDSD